MPKRKRTVDAIRADLERLVPEMVAAEAAYHDLLAQRAKLWVEARALDPQPQFSDLAEWSGTSRGAVAQVLRKARRAAEGLPRRTYGRVGDVAVPVVSPIDAAAEV